MGTTIQLRSDDDHVLDAYLAQPIGDAKRGALVVVQEIFGVNEHIRSVADRYAADGFVAIAPALFDRVQRGYQRGYAPEDIEAGIKAMRAIRWGDVVRDVTAAVNKVGEQRKCGVMGFCWGGAVAWLSAARVPDLACAVAYYGGAIPDLVNERPSCPVMLHFAENDASIPLDRAGAVARAHPECETFFYPGVDHGFNCDQRGSYNKAAAELARSRTLEFLKRHLSQT